MSGRANSCGLADGGAGGRERLSIKAKTKKSLFLKFWGRYHVFGYLLVLSPLLSLSLFLSFICGSWWEESHFIKFASVIRCVLSHISKWKTWGPVGFWLHIQTLVHSRCFRKRDPVSRQDVTNGRCSLRDCGFLLPNGDDVDEYVCVPILTYSVQIQLWLLWDLFIRRMWTLAWTLVCRLRRSNIFEDQKVNIGRHAIGKGLTKTSQGDLPTQNQLKFFPIWALDELHWARVKADWLFEIIHVEPNWNESV